MNRSSSLYAIIVAAGSGSRFGATMPKQFCEFAGRPLLMTTIDAIARVVPRDAIVLVLSPSMLPFWQELCREHGFDSPQIVFGGATRSESVGNALRRLVEEGCPEDSTVMIHDGARPMVTPELLRRVCSVPEGFAGIVPAVAVTDTLRHRQPCGTTHTADRSQFLAVQTPQSFTLGVVAACYAQSAGMTFTDDASLVEQCGYGEIAIAEGDSANIKITNPVDLAIAESILKFRS